MTSLPNVNNFVFGSAASAYSVRDAIASHRRAQYLVTSTNVASSVSDYTSSLDGEEHEDEDLIPEEDDLEAGTPEGERPGTRPIRGATWDELQWEDDLTPVPRDDGGDPGILLPAPGAPGEGIVRLPSTTTRPIQQSLSGGSETTPLLRKTISFTEQRPPGSGVAHAPSPKVQATRRPSHASMKSVHLVHAGSSTFGQTLFNTVAILLGIGMLSEPLAFACAGWVGGSALLFFYGILTCYTAKVLGKIMHTDPRIRSYSDVARKAFGPRATPFISTLFVLELFAVSIALVTLYADSLHSIVPIHSASTYKLIGAVILIPTTFMPLRLLSFTSFVGILSTIFIVIVLFIDGLAKKTSPGSLWEPAKTSIGPTSFGELGIAFGLLMAGFSGHAVIPSLARDMQDPSQFDTMVDWAFAAATVIYFLIGAAGYRMFGHSVYDEVSRNLISTPGYNSTLNRVALWTLVISPLSKFALTTRPVNYTLEIMLGLESFATTDEHRIKPLSAIQHTRHLLSWRQFFIALERIGFTLCSIIVSILVPEFSAMMAFLGAFSAFMLCVIGPICAKVALAHRCSVMDAAIIITGVVMAAWGTGAAIWSTG